MMVPNFYYRLNEWLPWFAWRPVRLTQGDYCGIAWLHTIERKRYRNILGEVWSEYHVVRRITTP